MSAAEALVVGWLLLALLLAALAILVLGGGLHNDG